MRGFRPGLAVLMLLALAGRSDAQGMPDLIVDQNVAAITAGIELQSFLPTDCALSPVDLCVDAPGARKLLRFTMETHNVGNANLVIGDPVNNPNPNYTFIHSPCHNHYHFVGFSNYELRPRGQPGVVATGHKESFCIEDTHPFAPIPPPQTYGCFNMGLSVGWSDRYDRTLDCQWIDITDVPPGDYDLAVTINASHLLPESDYTNNTAIVPVTIPADREPPARITVVPPNRGHALLAGDAVRLRWRRRWMQGRILYQEIWQSLDDGATYDLIDVLALNRRHYDWLVPLVQSSTSARIKIVAWSKQLKRGIGVSDPITLLPASAAATQKLRVNKKHPK